SYISVSLGEPPNLLKDFTRSYCAQHAVAFLQPLSPYPMKLTRNTMLLLLFLTFSCKATDGEQKGNAVAAKPNIVFILADDLGYGDIAPYGQTKIQTPHLTAMAGQGRRYTQFYAGSTVCAPSRAALMTGQ